MDILDELRELIAKLNQEKIEYALCGGLAMAIYALPRATLDIDLLIEAHSLEATRRAVNDLGSPLRLRRWSFMGEDSHFGGSAKSNPVLARR